MAEPKPLVHEGVPDWFIGEVAKKVGTILIPKPSRDIDEAGWRSTDPEVLYNEPFVPIGEIERSEKILEVFKESVYGVALIFEIEEIDDDVVVRRLESNHQDSPIETLSGDAMQLIEHEAQIFAKKVFADFKEFRGEATKPLSLVDELTETDDIEYDEPRIRTNKHSRPFMRLQVWGGPYKGKNIATDMLDFHVDGDPSSGPMRTHYIASICEDQTMGTRQVVGVSRHHFNRRIDESGNLPDGSITGVVEKVDRFNGLKDYGVDHVTAENGVIYRVGGSLDGSKHSLPEDNGSAPVRVLFRAHMQAENWELP